MARPLAAPLLIALSLASAARAQTSVPPSAILDAPPGEGRWHWIAVKPARSSPTGWVVLTGLADVAITGSRFHAELRPDPGQPTMGLSLDGRIERSRIRATELVCNTDAGPARVRGVLTMQRIGTRREERIALRGGQSGEASFLGMARTTSP